MKEINIKNIDEIKTDSEQCINRCKYRPYQAEITVSDFMLDIEGMEQLSEDISNSDEEISASDDYINTWGKINGVDASILIHKTLELTISADTVDELKLNIEKVKERLTESNKENFDVTFYKRECYNFNPSYHSVDNLVDK